MTPDITLGSRVFNAVNMERRTVILDHHLMRVMQQSGCDRVIPVARESAEAYLIRMQNTLLTSGCACDLLGCYLLPQGKGERDWTPDLARETALFVAALDTEDDRQRVAELALQVVFGFFKQRLDSLRTFLSSLPAAEPANQQSEKTAGA